MYSRFWRRPSAASSTPASPLDIDKSLTIVRPPDSPASFYSAASGLSKPSDMGNYRLFPVVSPTRPESPLWPERKQTTRSAEAQKRRSSFEAVTTQNAAGSNATDEYFRDTQRVTLRPKTATTPAPKTQWATKQAVSHPYAAGEGLGLSFEGESTPQTQLRSKPTLRIDMDNPPKPPPKSPRHSQVSSARSSVSPLESEPPARQQWPKSRTVVDNDTAGSPAHTPPTYSVVRTSYFQSTGKVLVREISSAGNRRNHSSAGRDSVTVEPSNSSADGPMSSAPSPPKRATAATADLRDFVALHGIVEDISPVEPKVAMANSTTSRDDAEDVASAVIAQSLQKASAHETTSSSAPEAPQESPGLLQSSTTPLALSQTLQDVAKQTEALHLRYSNLRADRLRLSASISLYLQEQKPSSAGYVNKLLDQYFELNAVNSSIDICFAKLKSLECKREEAIARLIEQCKASGVIDESKKHLEEYSNLTALPGYNATSPPPRESKMERPIASRALSEQDAVDRPRMGIVSRFAPKFVSRELESKRSTMIHTTTSQETLSEPTTPKLVSTAGTKAMSILGINNGWSTTETHVASAPHAPQASSDSGVSFNQSTAFEIGAHSRQWNSSETPLRAAPAPPPPTRESPSPPGLRNTDDSLASSISSMHIQSPVDEDDLDTPTSPRGLPLGPSGLKSAELPVLPTIKILVDEDVLDYFGSDTLY